MSDQYRLGIVGGGFMAHAIASGAVKRGFLKRHEILITEPNQERAEFLKSEGFYVVQDNATLAERCHFVLLAVKPQVFSAVAMQLKGSSPAVVLSIMAGKTKESVKRELGNVKVARAMPNLPCSVGEGMTAIDTSELLPEEQEFARSLFASVGKVVELKEDLLNAVTGVSGSGPAYVYLFLKSLAQAGVENGLSQEEAEILALQTLKGGVRLVEEQPQKSLDELIAAISSKGGTTVAALSQFEKDDFAGSVSRAVKAAVVRAEELSK